MAATIRTTIVTGAASGMGAAVVALLRSRGERAIGWDRSFSGGTADESHVDVTEPGQIDEAWQSAVESSGTVTGLVNGAGIWTTSPIEDTTPELWNREIGINLGGPFLTARLAVPHMREAGGGAIVNIASLAALRPPRIPSSAYAASKGGLVTFTKALAAEVGPYGIRCNCVSPGPIATPLLVARGLDSAAMEMYAKQAALGRMGQPEEVAAVIAFLLSDEASYVNGTNVEVAGG